MLFKKFFIQNYLWKEEIKNIIVVDLNSTDNTKNIIEKLEKEYEQISLLNWKECRELIENIKES